MIKSMTGYGSGECVGCDKKFTVEIRSVNHRYCDINIKVPRSLNFAEDAIRKILTKHIARGKVEVYLSVEGLQGDVGEVSVNMEIARGYYDALKALSAEFSLDDTIAVPMLSRFPEVFKLQRPEEDADAVLAAISDATEKAALAFTKMREVEGGELYRDLSAVTSEVETLLGAIEIRTPKIVKEFAERLEGRMRELLEAVPVDENRLLNEVAIFADKVNINEECIRLKSHIDQMRAFLESETPIGRKMDFLMQEMNREANTIGSKSNDLEVARLVIDMKAAIEKLREQVQNVE